MSLSTTLVLLLVSTIFGFTLGKTQYKKQTAERYEVSVRIESNGEYSVTDTLDTTYDVLAYFEDSMETIGWGILEVKIQNLNGTHKTDARRAFAAGIAEGYLTSKQIYYAYINMLNTSFWDFTHSVPSKLTEFVDTQKSWMAEKVSSNDNNDDFWTYAGILQSQLEGLQYGYNLTAANNGVPTFNDSWPFSFLNMAGDLLDLMTALNLTATLDWYSMTAEEYLYNSFKRNHCSALIKVSPLLDNFMIGHSTWFTFQDMNRIFKHYIFNFNQQFASTHMMFSSYPGYLESWDDYYVMDSGLAMIQTTNDIPDTSLYAYVIPQSLYSWHRVRIANALATTGKQWYEQVSRYNSGTYNNQYMIINYATFAMNEPLPNGFLWVIEQIPGTVYGEDKTDVLERGYWGSYNVPALELIYNLSGYPELVAKVGVTASYQLAPRARIFRRDAGKIETMSDFQTFLRYNDYEHDSIQNNNPLWAICARGDLLTMANNNESATVDGCYDTKVANYSMILNMQTNAISSPTYENVPPFTWEKFPVYKHYGIPTVMNFSWYWMQSELANM